ncbi:hypothetical protein PR048_025185 [Dryococelus australis]|uniref:Uncharacterized protein n=1 Tax=Dryococelus australis TaxID=614101 RepID=A0ABQ9GQN9_9NEOP|nr:hypothetical protein PR048_025185 [Dryococelus australis]
MRAPLVAGSFLTRSWVRALDADLRGDVISLPCHTPTPETFRETHSRVLAYSPPHLRLIYSAGFAIISLATTSTIRCLGMALHSQLLCHHVRDVASVHLMHNYNEYTDILIPTIQQSHYEPLPSYHSNHLQTKWKSTRDDSANEQPQLTPSHSIGAKTRISGQPFPIATYGTDDDTVHHTTTTPNIRISGSTHLPPKSLFKKLLSPLYSQNISQLNLQNQQTHLLLPTLSTTSHLMTPHNQSPENHPSFYARQAFHQKTLSNSCHNSNPNFR